MVKELFQLLIDCIKSPKKYLDNIIDTNQTRHQLLLLILIFDVPNMVSEHFGCS